MHVNRFECILSNQTLACDIYYFGKILGGAIVTTLLTLLSNYIHHLKLWLNNVI